MYIAAVKPVAAVCLALVALSSSPMHASDDQAIKVTSSSTSDGIVSIEAENGTKVERLTCFLSSRSCSSVAAGDYVIARATTEQGIYNDCTNVVLYRSGAESREPVGVYCWETSGDCYMACPTDVHIGTIPSTVANEVKVEEICKEQTRPDCVQAVAFFEKFQKAVAANNRASVVSMVNFPLRALLRGKKILIKNKEQLLSQYDVIFDSAVRCAIARAKPSDVWGNWQGFTVSKGATWWERGTSPSAPFKVITVNNGGYYPGCGEAK